MNRLLLLQLVFLSNVAYAGLVVKEEMQFIVPLGWKEIPTVLIAKKAASIPNKPSNYKLPTYGFQSDNEWFVFPLVMVEIHHDGKMKRADLEKIQTVDMEKIRKKTKENLKDIASMVEIDTPRFDRQTNTIWMVSRMNRQGTGDVTNLTAMIPTEDGWIQFNGSTLTENMNSFLMTFQKIIKSTKIVPSMAYR